MSNKSIADRLTFANEHVSSSGAKRERVFFRDESKFILIGFDEQVAYKVLSVKII